MVLGCATSLRNAFVGLDILVAAGHHIVVRVVVGFFTILMPHFQIVNQFVLADLVA